MITLPDKRWMWIFLGATAATFALGFLAANISERRVENLRPTQVMVTPIGDWETDPSVWGHDFPREYQTWLKTRENGGRTKWGGSDPYSKLEKYPNLLKLYAGYSFAKDYNRKRGHGYAMEDVLRTKRTNDTTLGTCFTCKSPDVPKLMKEVGVAAFYASNFKQLAASGKIKHSISCLDCHDPRTMDLRISRPAFTEAMAKRGIDVAKATHQEMRSYVCAQCHVTYYFHKQDGYLKFPWDKGLNIDDIVSYFQEDGFADWTHPVSNTPMIKIRHPEFELWSAGVHAYRGVACADCHMPYQSEGGVKITSHHVKSPLLGNLSVSCQVCHRWSEAEIKARVESIQDKTMQLQVRAEEAINAAHEAVGECMKAGVADEQLKPARNLIREAQARWDFISSENSTGFHAPQEASRILGFAIDQSRQAESLAQQLSLKMTLRNVQSGRK